MNNIKQLKTDFDNLIIEKIIVFPTPKSYQRAIELENILNNTLKNRRPYSLRFLFLNLLLSIFAKCCHTAKRIPHKYFQIFSLILFSKTISLFKYLPFSTLATGTVLISTSLPSLSYNAPINEMSSTSSSTTAYVTVAVLSSFSAYFHF